MGLGNFDEKELRRAREIIPSYRDQERGVADALIVVLTERYRTRTIASLDRRHFGGLRSLDGGYFEVLRAGGLTGPADLSDQQAQFQVLDDGPMPTWLIWETQDTVGFRALPSTPLHGPEESYCVSMAAPCSTHIRFRVAGAPLSTGDNQAFRLVLNTP